MNVNKQALDKAYRLAHDSGKVETGRLVKALALVPSVNKTFAHIYTDKSRIEEYWIAGSKNTGYVVTVRNQKSVSPCTCQDSQQRETAYCKHRLAVMLILKAQQIDPESVTASPVPVSLDDDYRARMLSALWPND